MGEDASNHRSPTFKTAQGRRFGAHRPSSKEPRPSNRQQGTNQFSPMLTDPRLQVWVPESCPLPRTGAGGVQTDPITPARKVRAQLQIIPSRNPRASNRQGDRLTLTENSI